MQRNDSARSDNPIVTPSPADIAALREQARRIVAPRPRWKNQRRAEQQAAQRAERDYLARQAREEREAFADRRGRADRATESERRALLTLQAQAVETVIAHGLPISAARELMEIWAAHTPDAPRAESRIGLQPWLAINIKPQAVIYTDGACDPNPGPGGWATLIRTDEREQEFSGGEQETTSNRMELRAVIASLEALETPSRVRLHTDSEYVQRGATQWLTHWKANGWRTRTGKPVANRDLWERLDQARQRHVVEWIWDKGHAGDPDNERVHRLAGAAIPESAVEVFKPANTPLTSELQLKAHAYLAAAMLKAGHTEAFALWLLARALDAAGQGHVALGALRAHALALGLTLHRFDRMLRQAERADFVQRGRLHEQGETLFYRSLLDVAQRYDLPVNGLGWPVWVAPTAITGAKRWKAMLLAALLEGRSQAAPEQPISCQTILNLTGVAERTQREYRKFVGVKACRHYLLLDISAQPGIAEGLRDCNIVPGAFAFRDSKSGQSVVARPLPQSYTTSLARAPRGTSRKVNELLRHALLENGGGQRALKLRQHRIFWDDRQAAEEAHRGANVRPLDGIPSGLQEDVPDERFYRHERRYAHIGVWGKA